MNRATANQAMRRANYFQHHHHHLHQEQKNINGPRPTPLKISKESHIINKTSSVAAAKQQQRSHPVIIYTRSPKVIHTQPRDFKALVQKLTGNSPRSLNNKATRKPPTYPEQEQEDHDEKDDSTSKSSSRPADNESSSGLSSTNQNGHPNFADIPLFTPNSSNFSCSSRPVHRYSDLVYPLPNMVGSVSPSILEFVKGLPEY